MADALLAGAGRVLLAWPALSAGTLALYLPFDDAAGPAFADASGNDFDGACSGDNCPTAGVSGKVDGALQFDGTDDYCFIKYNLMDNSAAGNTAHNRGR
jgi:hypothetical protein